MRDTLSRSMPLFHLFLLLSSLLIFGTGPVLAQSGKQVHWYDIELPPYHSIREGPFRGQGITDRLTRLLQREMPEYAHTRTLVNTNRVLWMLRNGEAVCNPSLKKTPEREAFIHFSMPSIFFPANGIAVKKEDSEQFGKAPVSLESLLVRADLILGVESGRAYGQPIDAMLRRFYEQTRVEERVASNAYEGLIEMLVRDHVDYVLGYPVEMEYVGRKLGLEDQLLFLELEETDPYTVSHVGCSKTPAGKAIIERVNQILLEQRPTQEYRSFMERWLDGNTLEEYRKAYDSQFLKMRQ